MHILLALISGGESFNSPALKIIFKLNSSSSLQFMRYKLDDMLIREILYYSPGIGRCGCLWGTGVLEFHAG